MNTPEPREAERDITNDRFKIFLKRADQVALALVILGCSAIFAVTVLIHFSRDGGLVDIDEAEHRQALFQVNVNQADWPEIANLPGIGEVTARTIIEFRETNGPFSSVDSLIEIKGIGPKTIEKIKPYLFVSENKLVRQ